MRYFIREDGQPTQVDETTNPTYCSKCISNTLDKLDEQNNIICKATWYEITEQEYKALTEPSQEQLNQLEQEQVKQERIAEIKSRLSQLSEDIIQDQVGEYVPDMAERKNEFITLHNELRELEGKTPRFLK